MRKSGALLPIVLLALCAGIAVVAVLVPTATLLQPLDLHTPELIERSYRFDRAGRWLAIGLVFVGGWLFSLAWRRGREIERSVAALPLMVVIAAAVFSGERVIEWMMFEPVEAIRFVALEEATHVADEQLVMGIEAGDEARAYPVQMVAYHHIVNDRLAGEPYVVTY